MVIPGLDGIATGFDALEDAIEQRARAAASIPIDHEASRIVAHGRDRLLRGPAFEPLVALPEDDALLAAVAVDEVQRRREKRTVILIADRVEQMDASDVALAAHRRVESRRAADREKPGAHASLLNSPSR